MHFPIISGDVAVEMEGLWDFDFTNSPLVDVTTTNYTDDGRISSDDFYETRRRQNHIEYNIMMGTIVFVSSISFLLYLIEP